MTRKAARTRKSKSKKAKSQEEDAIMTEADGAAPPVTANAAAAASSDIAEDSASAGISQDDVLSKLPDNRFELEVRTWLGKHWGSYLQHMMCFLSGRGNKDT